MPPPTTTTTMLKINHSLNSKIFTELKCMFIPHLIFCKNTKNIKQYCIRACIYSNKKYRTTITHATKHACKQVVGTLFKIQQKTVVKSTLEGYCLLFLFNDHHHLQTNRNSVIKSFDLACSFPLGTMASSITKFCCHDKSCSHYY